MSTHDKVIITCAMSGAVTTRAQCEAIPYTVDDYAREAKRAYDAGAVIVHIHARTDDGVPSFEPARYAAIGEAIRAACPIILNFSTGTIDDEQKKAEHVKTFKPEIGALNMGSMNYAKYNAKKKNWVFNFVFQNRFEDIQYLIEMMNGAGVKPELECFDTGHVHSTEPLLDMGLLKPPLDFSLIMGVVGGIKATARHLAFQAENLPPGSTWKVIGISRDQWMLCAAALSLGGQLRVGLEDNFYLPNGEMARSNGDLVGKAAQMARDVGRTPATVDEARVMLNLAAKVTSMYATIEWSVDGYVGTIKLNRPDKKNVIGPDMVNELLDALEAATNDAGIRVVVLGANGKVFCGGGDLGQMSGGASDAPALPIKGDYSDLLLALVRMKKPVIAKVHGAAMGGGLGLVAASTFSVASTDARLGTPEIDVGLFPMMIMSVLARTMPRRALLEMMLLGKKLAADEALRVGLLNRVVTPDRLDAEVSELAGQLAQKSPTAIARGMAAWAKMGDMALAEALPWLRDELYGLLGTEDAREGLMAFMQKRTPTWVGR